MNKETLQKIFNETHDEYMAEMADEDKVKEKVSQYADENGKLNVVQAMTFAYHESFERSVHFMWDVFKKIIELNENSDSQESN